MQLKKILWMFGITGSGFLLMLLIIGTRIGERKAKLSSKDLGALTEIELDEDVISASITNVRMLYVVVSETVPVEKDRAQHLCQVLKRNEALVESVRIIKPATSVIHKVGKIKNQEYVLLGECNCSPFRIN
jgi:hypothetical protein